MAHFALLKIQIPMNAIIMSKTLLSIGLMDFKDWQSSSFKHTIFGVDIHQSPFVNLME